MNPVNTLTTEHEQQIALNKMRHDLKAQLINIQGLSRELQRSVGKLNSQISHDKPELPDEFVKTVKEIINNDLLTCLEFLDHSTHAMDDIVIEIFEDK